MNPGTDGWASLVLESEIAFDDTVRYPTLDAI